MVDRLHTKQSLQKVAKLVSRRSLCLKSYFWQVVAKSCSFYIMWLWQPSSKHNLYEGTQFGGPTFSGTHSTGSLHWDSITSVSWCILGQWSKSFSPPLGLQTKGSPFKVKVSLLLIELHAKRTTGTHLLFKFSELVKSTLSLSKMIVTPPVQTHLSPILCTNEGFISSLGVAYFVLKRGVNPPTIFKPEFYSLFTILHMKMYPIITIVNYSKQTFPV